MEVYENHLGGIYFTDEVRPFDDLYCEVCGDSDWHLGHADTWEEVMKLITDEDGWCPYAKDYLAELKARFEAEREGEPQQKSCATCKHALGNWDGESNNCVR